MYSKSKFLLGALSFLLVGAMASSPAFATNKKLKYVVTAPKIQYSNTIYTKEFTETTDGLTTTITQDGATIRYISWKVNYNSYYAKGYNNVIKSRVCLGLPSNGKCTSWAKPTYNESYKLKGDEIDGKNFYLQVEYVDTSNTQKKILCPVQENAYTTIHYKY